MKESSQETDIKQKYYSELYIAYLCNDLMSKSLLNMPIEALREELERKEKLQILHDYFLSFGLGGLCSQYESVRIINRDSKNDLMNFDIGYDIRVEIKIPLHFSKLLNLFEKLYALAKYQVVFLNVETKTDDNEFVIGVHLEMIGNEFKQEKGVTKHGQ